MNLNLKTYGHLSLRETHFRKKDSHIKLNSKNSFQTWMTYSWSLSWANVDKAFYVEQETKAGFWNQDIQVLLIKEYIQELVFR